MVAIICHFIHVILFRFFFFIKFLFFTQNISFCKNSRWNFPFLPVLNGKNINIVAVSLRPIVSILSVSQQAFSPFCQTWKTIRRLLERSA